MKIIKKSRDDREKAIIFTCGRCGCVFEAEKGEYRQQSIGGGRLAACECPRCKADVVRSIDVVRSLV